MTSGVPCIAYDCPSGPGAIIEEGINGFLIEDENVDSFVQKLELLIEDDDLRILMGVNAQKSVKKYEIDTIMKSWDGLFRHLKNNSAG
ncbi:UDP-D-galactose:(glucosyl)lipopolysaccharide-1,6-D-galactosyltransferase [compost metagenome]